jgi:quinoprotein glucose dehydrogenase
MYLRGLRGRGRRGRGAVGLCLCLLLAACGGGPELDTAGPLAQWPDYGGDKGGLNFSPLTQITPENVDRLELAWVHHSGDFSDGSDGTTRTSFEARPIVVDDTLYYCTPYNRVFALDPETGEARWSFDPQVSAKKLSGPYPLVCRGVAWWAGGGPADLGACARRIFTGTVDSQLIALDAKTGRPCADFGRDGRVDLREGIGEGPAWEYHPTSPPLVVGDLVVVGALVADNFRVDAPSGVVRAFDARTGALRWAWDPVPPDWDPEASRRQTGRRYQRGTPNVWTILSADPERGIVYVPTGNASPDTLAAIRSGLDYYASSVVALDARSGRALWHFQTVHHDVWDYDVPAEPALFRIPSVGDGAPGLAQITKMGHLFLLDRETGVPLYPVEERPVPATDVPGEELSPTQPFPTHPGPLAPAELRPEDAWGFTFIDRGDCRRRIESLRSEGIFTPPSLQGSVQYPGNAGGPNWGGVSIDPARGVLYVNQMRAAAAVTLVPREEFEKLDPDSVVWPDELYPMTGAPYGLRRQALLSKWGTPCVPPPWGTLSAVDLASGEVLWESTLGTTRDQAPWPLWLAKGAPNLGGSLATAGGVVFIGATTDKFFRAFDAETGAEIWRARIPYTANASPVSYRLRRQGRQFVVIAAGGHGWSEPGDALLAFALPE